MKAVAESKQSWKVEHPQILWINERIEKLRKLELELKDYETFFEIDFEHHEISPKIPGFSRTYYFYENDKVESKKKSSKREEDLYMQNVIGSIT